MDVCRELGASRNKHLTWDYPYNIWSLLLHLHALVVLMVGHSVHNVYALITALKRSVPIIRYVGFTAAYSLFLFNVCMHVIRLRAWSKALRASNDIQIIDMYM